MFPDAIIWLTSKTKPKEEVRAAEEQPFSLVRRAFSWEEMQEKILTVLAENAAFALLPQPPSEGSEVLNVNLILLRLKKVMLFKIFN